MKTSEKLKEVRETLGMTREELANKLGVTAQIIANMELDRRKIYADDIAKISEAFGMTPSQFYDSEIRVNRRLTVEQDKLLNEYEKLSKASKETIESLIQRLQQIEGNKTITFLPMFNESEVPTVELDYYDQAAGMGLGEYVKDAIPEKVNVPEMNVPPDTDYIIRVTGDSMEPTFNSGDRLFIQKTECLNPGDIGVFNYMGEQYVKEFGNGELISHNRKYPPIKIVDNLYIQGKVLGKV